MIIKKNSCARPADSYNTRNTHPKTADPAAAGQRCTQRVPAFDLINAQQQGREIDDDRNEANHR
jgi:hypothetical protein